MAYFLKLVSTVRPNFFDGAFSDLRLLERKSLQSGVGGGAVMHAPILFLACQTAALPHNKVGLDSH